MSAPRISVIIPNYNSPVIHQTLEALRGQQGCDLDMVEVLVVGHDDLGLVCEDKLVTAIPTGGPTSPAHNRNLGMQAARGDILCFTDADCLPAADWLFQLTAPYQRSDVHVVGGSVAFDEDNYWLLCDHVSWFHRSLTTMPPGIVPLLVTLNLSLRRAVVAAAGPLDEEYAAAAGEDTEWSMRIREWGYALHFEPKAVVRHQPTRSGPRDLWRHGYQYGQHSPKVRCRPPLAWDRDRTALIPRSWWQLLMAAPMLASLATLRVLATHPRHLWAWRALPGVWVSKVAWCIGASRTLRKGAPD